MSSPGEKYASHESFIRETDRRAGSGEALRALWAQESAIIEADVCFVDLPALRHEGTFPPEFKTTPESKLALTDFLGGSFGEKRYLDCWERTNKERLHTQVDEFCDSHPEILERLKIESLNDLDPAVAATLALEMTAASLRYANELVSVYASKLTPQWQPKVAEMKAAGTYVDFLVTENKRYDEATVDQLLGDDKAGVCRHYALAAMGIYEDLKTRDQVGSLNDTFLVPKAIIFDAQDVDFHAFNVLVAHREGWGTMVSLTDPTWYNGGGGANKAETFTDSRLASAVDTIGGSELREKLQLPTSELQSALDQKLRDLEGRYLNPKFCDSTGVSTLLSLAAEKAMVNETSWWSGYSQELAKETARMLELSEGAKNQVDLIDTMVNSPVLVGSRQFGVESLLCILDHVNVLADSGSLEGFWISGDDLLKSLEKYQERLAGLDRADIFMEKLQLVKSKLND